MELVERRPTNSRMLTTTEVAHLLHVHPNTVRLWANKELLHAYRLGTRGDRRFMYRDLDAFLKGNGSHSREAVEAGKA